MRIIEMIKEVRADKALADEEREHKELALRNIADGIAVLLLQTKSHFIRRFILHDEPQFTPDATLDEAAKAAERLNNESRMTFALVADLTTFIHVCDILRFDVRNKKLSLIELKTGRVNQMLLGALERYSPEPSSMNLLESDETIDPKHLKQAKRMLRQKIRVQQVEQMFTSDDGIDISLEMPLKLVKEMAELDFYDEFLNDLCNQARSESAAAGLVDQCLHLGVGFAAEKEQARATAKCALRRGIALSRNEPPDGLPQVDAETWALVPARDRFIAVESVSGNLRAMSNRPIVTWAISRENLLSGLQGELAIFIAFDVSGFIHMGRRLGLEMGLSSEKAASQTAQSLGSSNVPTWGRRCLKMSFGAGKEILLLTGMLSRFIHDLASPKSMLKFDLAQGWEGIARP